jgi:hypothetical protein
VIALVSGPIHFALGEDQLPITRFFQFRFNRLHLSFSFFRGHFGAARSLIAMMMLAVSAAATWVGLGAENMPRMIIADSRPLSRFFLYDYRKGQGDVDPLPQRLDSNRSKSPQA